MLELIAEIGCEDGWWLESKLRMAIWPRSRLGSPFMDEAGGQIEPNTRDDCSVKKLNLARMNE